MATGDAPRATSRPAGEPVVIAGPAGAIEARWTVPEVTPLHCTVVCHPHPLHGGTMDNKVVTTLIRAASARGAATVRFNFRGVGASAGRYDEGVGEVDDAVAVVDWALSQVPGARLWLLGFSFGSRVALAAARLRRPERLVCVAPPVGRLRFEDLSPPDCPWMVVQGEADEIIDVACVIDWARRIAPAPRLELLPGVSHFFHGHLHQLTRVVDSFLG